MFQAFAGMILLPILPEASRARRTTGHKFPTEDRVHNIEMFKKFAILVAISFLLLRAGHSQSLNRHGTVEKMRTTTESLIINVEQEIFPEIGSRAYVFEKIQRAGSEKLITVAKLEVNRVENGRVWAGIVERIEDSTLVGRAVSFSSTRAVLRVVPDPGNVTIQIDTVEYQEKDSITVALGPGTHRVQVSRWGYESRSEELQLQSGDWKRLSVRLSPGPSLRSQGDGTSVLVHPSGVSIDMVQVGAGRYQRGDWRGGGYSDQKPVRTVTLSGFRISQKEITVNQFRTFVENTGYTTTAEEYGCWTTNAAGKRTKEEGATWRDPGFSQKGTHPVVCVSWRDAEAFADWIDARLPTEAEWEYVARAGGQKIIYPWGSTFNANRLNFADRSTSFSNASADDGHRWTAPVGSYPPSEIGVYNIGGNVSEWCRDWYQRDYYATSSSQNPMGPSRGDEKVYRGGSWADNSTYAQTTIRRKADPNLPADNVGFRIVWEPKK
jgi:sulfatase modifying factor 1